MADDQISEKDSRKGLRGVLLAPCWPRRASREETGSPLDSCEMVSVWPAIGIHPRTALRAIGLPWTILYDGGFVS
jgi:hypothetical protein